MGASAPPGRRKFFRRNSQEKFVSALPAHKVHPPPQAEQESILRTFLGDLEVGVVDLVVLDHLLRATSKKVVNFLRKKVHPRQNHELKFFPEQTLISVFEAVIETSSLYATITGLVHRAVPFAGPHFAFPSRMARLS